jgi:hypothetical protein
MIAAQPAQRDRPDCRVDVALYEPRVPVRSRGSNVPSLVRHPRAGQELCDGERASAWMRACDTFAVESSNDGLGFTAVEADRDPSAALTSTQRVEAVVGDDVEAVAAFNDVGHPRSSTTSTRTRRGVLRLAGAWSGERGGVDGTRPAWRWHTRDDCACTPLSNRPSRGHRQSHRSRTLTLSVCEVLLRRCSQVSWASRTGYFTGLKK